jgi:hypothetical protein
VRAHRPRRPGRETVNHNQPDQTSGERSTTDARVTVHDPDSAPEASRDLVAALSQRYGKVLNIHSEMAHAPMASSRTAASRPPSPNTGRYVAWPLPTAPSPGSPTDGGCPGQVTPGAKSQRLMTRRCGVLAEDDRPGLQTGVAQELVHQPGGSADAGPVVIPQRRNQPGAVRGEHQVRQGALPNDQPPICRQMAACCGPPQPAHSATPAYKVTLGASGKTTSSASVSRYPSHHGWPADCSLSSPSTARSCSSCPSPP